jgi:hypothetical protein
MARALLMQDIPVKDRVDFTLAGDDVQAGYFAPEDVPRQAGEYRYMPYRSVAHLRMSTSLRAGTPVTCWCEVAGERLVFVVTATRGYGRLAVTDVRSAGRDT